MALYVEHEIHDSTCSHILFLPLHSETNTINVFYPFIFNFLVDLHWQNFAEGFSTSRVEICFPLNENEIVFLHLFAENK